MFGVFLLLVIAAVVAIAYSPLVAGLVSEDQPTTPPPPSESVEGAPAPDNTVTEDTLPGPDNTVTTVEEPPE